MYGGGPAANEAEITLFGPGYGEAIAVHLGDAQWLLVDSCRHPGFAEPAPLHYLDSIGVPRSAVRGIVASHWHDDHVAGISRIADACPDAPFFIADVFADKEAQAFLSAYGSNIAKPQARGARELHAVASARKNIRYVHYCSIVLEDVIQARQMRVVAFSPTHNAKTQALLRMASFVPRSTNEPINHAPELSPNLEAVVLHVDFGDDALLLASDLENHGLLGWQEICDDVICKNQRKASAFKVGHHGSPTAHHSGIWQQLLANLPIAILTPYNNGRVHLPSKEDQTRIAGLSSRAYTTSAGSSRPRMPPYQLKRMSDLCPNLSVVNVDFGAVRLRKPLGTAEWHAELFGRAAQLAA